MSEKTGAFFVHIRSRRPIWDVDWYGLLHYRDLMWLMVRRDFVSKYKQTILGPAWMVIQPLVTTVVFTIVFGKVMQISTEGAPPMLFYMCGLLIWNLFAQVLGSTGNVLQANFGLFGKVYFPRMIVPIANSISALIPFGIQLVAFLILFFYYKFFQADGASLEISPRILLLPLFVIQALAVGFGAGLILSSLTAVYRDLQHTLGFATQIWMYATPVIYPISKVLEKLPDQWHWLIQLNPLIVPVEGTKWCFLGIGSLTPSSLVISWCVTLLILVTGFFYYNTVERSYIDRA